MTAKQDVYLNDKGKAVPAGPEARVLLVRAGQEIPDEKAQGIDGAVELINAAGKKSAPKHDGAKDLETRGGEHQESAKAEATAAPAAPAAAGHKRKKK